MHESERPRVEHRARRFDPSSCVVADVDALADQRMAQLGQMDSNLVLAAGFEAALDQRGAGERRERPHVRHRAFRLGRNIALRAPKVAVRAANAVAAIQEKVRLDARRRDGAVRNGVIDAFRIVRAELRRQRALRRRRPRKDHQAAGVLVEAMDHAELAVDAVAPVPRSSVRAWWASVSLFPGSSATLSIPAGLSTTTTLAVGKHDRAVGERSGAKLRRLLIDDDQSRPAERATRRRGSARH